jgi:hypothetical protein
MAQALSLGVKVASTVVSRPSHDRYPRRHEVLTA